MRCKHPHLSDQSIDDHISGCYQSEKDRLKAINRDLLEAAKALVAIYDCRPDTTRDDFCYAATIAKEAIAKAEGKND